MKFLEIRQKIEPERHIARADVHLADVKVQHLFQFLLTKLDLLQPPAHIGSQKFSLFCQFNAAACPRKQTGSERALQLMKGLGNRGLRNREFIRRLRE